MRIEDRPPLEFAPEALPAGEPEASKKSRFGFLRRAGHMATNEVVEITQFDLDQVGIYLEAEILFGLERDLDEYQGLWARHEGLVNDFITDNSELISTVIAGHRQAVPGRDQRRDTAKYQGKDFEPMAAIFAIAGRLSGIGTKEQLDENNAVRSALDYRHTMRRTETKRKALVATLKPTPSTHDLGRKLSELEKESHDTYKPIFKKEKKINDRVIERISGDPYEAQVFLDTFLDFSASEVKSEKAFASLFANNYLTDPEESALAIALKTVQEGAKNGGFVESYLHETVAKNEGDTILGFFARSYQPSEELKTFVEYMLSKKPEWPNELQEAYRAFANERMNSYLKRVKPASERSLKKSWLHPTPNDYEEMVERHFKQMYGPLRADLVRPKNAPASQTPARYKLNPADLLKEESAMEPENPLFLSRLIRTPKGLIEEAKESTDELLEDLVTNDQRNPDYVSDMSKIIEKLRVEPFGIGTRSIAFKRPFSINGKSRKVYRASPHDMQALKVSDRARRSRILFTVNDGSLSVYAVAKNHAEYERIVGALVNN